jgi:pimeloyl-ACP methyl ester carboxylesterase
VVNRLVLWLSYLRTHPLGSEPGSYWGQFLKADTTSPYDNTALTVPTGADGGYYPVWGTASSTVNIELAGHSQGGGAAAFVASTLPTNVQIRRVIMLSSPQDSYSYNGGTSSPAWIRSSTIGSRAWGLRHGQGTGSSDEGNYGNTVSQNWSNFGAAVSASPLTGNEDVLSDSADAGCLTNSGTVSNPSMTDCTSLPNLSTSTHRYVIADPQLPADSPDLNAHDSTAANSYLTNGRTSNSIGWGVCTSGEDCSVLNPNEAYIWDRMLTGN